MVAVVAAQIVSGAQQVSAAQARAIAKQAYIYGYPMIQSYLTMYAFSIDKNNPHYKGPFNAPLSFARVFTPDDTAFVTPNPIPHTLFWVLTFAPSRSFSPFRPSKRTAGGFFR